MYDARRVRPIRVPSFLSNFLRILTTAVKLITTKDCSSNSDQWKETSDCWLATRSWCAAGASVVTGDLASRPKPAEACFDTSYNAQLSGFADAQVAKRTAHLWGSYAPAEYVAANKREWVELHTRLNGGVALPDDQVLPYFFDAAASWCGANPLQTE